LVVKSSSKLYEERLSSSQVLERRHDIIDPDGMDLCRIAGKRSLSADHDDSFIVVR